MPASIKILSKTKELGKAISTILAKWEPDSRYYKVVQVLGVDKDKKKCRVVFEDKTEFAIDCKNLHVQLALEYLNDDEFIVCAICDKGHSDPQNEIIMCDTCQQGYHVKCHKPNLDKSVLDDEVAAWDCNVCTEITGEPPRAKAVRKTTEKPRKVTTPCEVEESPEDDTIVEDEVPDEDEAPSEDVAPAEDNATCDDEPPRKDSQRPKSSTPKPKVSKALNKINSLNSKGIQKASKKESKTTKMAKPDVTSAVPTKGFLKLITANGSAAA